MIYYEGFSFSLLYYYLWFLHATASLTVIVIQVTKKSWLRFITFQECIVWMCLTKIHQFFLLYFLLWANRLHYLIYSKYMKRKQYLMFATQYLCSPFVHPTYLFLVFWMKRATTNSKVQVLKFPVACVDPSLNFRFTEKKSATKTENCKINHRQKTLQRALIHFTVNPLALFSWNSNLELL